jgi:uncharacterized protein with HEPN domain
VKDPHLPLRHILDAIERIEDYASPGRQAFDGESMRRDAIVRNLEVIGEAVPRLSVDVRERAPEFAWRDPIGMRDWLIHGYDVVDLDIVWDTVITALPILKEVVVHLLGTGQKDLPDQPLAA